MGGPQLYIADEGIKTTQCVFAAAPGLPGPPVM